MAIAEYIAGSGVDVLGLCEIDDTDESEARRNDVLDTAFAVLNEEPDQDWQYELFSNKNPNDKTQLCGVAWNAKQVTREEDTFALTIDDEEDDEFYLWYRHPHAVKFRAGDQKTDFVVVPVHMKSNVRPSDPERARGRTGAEFGAAQRLLEAEALLSQTPAIQEQFEGEKDIIILGDTNILDRHEEAIAKFKQAGFSDLNSEDAASFVRGKAPFDRIFVSDQREFIYARQRILTDTAPAEHEEYLSDHYLISTTFRVVSDDD